MSRSVADTAPVGPLPGFLIIGAARSGTTALAHWLGDHPGIWMAAQKEVRFFDTERRWAKGEPWYRAQFADAPPGAVVGEASPGYMFSADAPARIASVVPGVRLVALLRDPIDRAWSHYWYLRGLGHEHRDPETALTAVEQPRGHEYLERGLYLAQIRRMLDHHDRDHLLVLLHDDLSDDAHGLFSEVVGFVGADVRDTPDSVGAPENAPYRVRSARVRDAVYHRLRLKSRAPRLTAFVDRHVLTTSIDYRPIDDGLRSLLLPRVREDVEALEAWLGRDLTSWRS